MARRRGATTRLLILGVLLDKPRHGYEVRAELELWSTDRWANVAYGSIYFALKKLADEGLLQVDSTEEGAGGRAGRTVYAITDLGRAEFERLLREVWLTYEPGNDPFKVALTFMDRLPRDELLAALRRREALLRADVEGLDAVITFKRRGGAPRHVDEILRLGAVRGRAELAWLAELIAKVEHGELP
jgi:DNA-binding PadR family transcriptional regulator